jgi:outer membrane biosynthesis protein TonB
MYTKKGRIVMRLKKVMAITLAAGLTVGSIAIAATSPLSSDSLKGAVSSVAPPAGDPGITGPNGGGSTATTAPTDAPTDKPTDAPTDKPTDAPATSTPKPTVKPTPKPSVKKPGKVSATKKTIKGAKKKITVKIKKVSGAAGYQIQYSTKKNFSKAVKSKNVTKASTVTLKNVKKGTYYVRVRAYKKSGSKKVYGSWSAKIKVKVTK